VNHRTSLGACAWIGIWAALATVLLADANRFLPPGGEKYTDRMGYGGADLLPSFNSAHAFLAGQNPYHYTVKHLPEPISYGGYKYQYPPTHFLIYVPLALIAGKSLMTAARIQFFLTLAVTVLLAIAVLKLVGAVTPLAQDLRAGLLPIIALVLTLNPGTQLGLERGQSDMITAALCWWAAACFQREKHGLAAFLAIAAGLLKGYGVPFGAGLLLLGLRRKTRRATLLGAALAIGLLLLPVAKYLPDALGALPTRAQMFWSMWNNQSFYNLVYTLEPKFATHGRHVMVGFAGLVTLLAWWRLSKSIERDDAERPLALALYTTASLTFILGFSLNSLAYALVLVLPGALLLTIVQSRLYSGANRFAPPLIGCALALIMVAMCAMSVPRLIGRAPTAPDIPVHAVGQVLLLCIIAGLSLRGHLIAEQPAPPASQAP
jgi:hypothetical protein